MTRISLIAALGRDRVIGRDGGLPWHLPADLKRFKELTLGHPIIMGRKTHESIGRALPGRANLVVTRQRDYRAEGCVVVGSLEEALSYAVDDDEVFVIGGASLYAEALPVATRMYLTYVDGEFDGDVYFPPYDESAWTRRDATEHAPDDRNPHRFRFVTLDRV